MNPTEVSGLACAGLHDTSAGEQSYATECPEMNQGPFHETTNFEASMETPAKHSNSNTCLDGNQHTGIMAGTVQAAEEVKFGSMQHLEARVSDSDDESLSSSPKTSSTSNYGYMEQPFENYYNTLDEMDDKDGLVMLNPEFVLCDMALHLQPHLTFSSDGFKIEHFDCDSREDDKMVALYWDVSDIISINSKWTQTVESASITLMVRPSAETESSGPIRVEFCLTDPQWPQKQEKICYLASRYDEIWDNTPSEDFASENWSTEPSLFFPKQYFSDTEDFEDVIYPKGDRDAVSVSSRDVDLLLPETFVNDTIIDFYIKYLSSRIESTERCRYHFFNSFFFRKLADLDKDQGRAPEGRSAFLRVRKWTRKIDIFAKDFLFIPVNFSLHWSLIVICHPGEVVTSKDEAENHGKLPCILHMDSLKGSHSGLKDIIQSYLWEEWKERHPESALDISDKFSNLRFVSLELPQQDNSFDCGLFLLHYVERFLMDAPRSFNPLKIDVFSTFLSDNWFVPAEASLKRSLIRKLIHQLVADPSQDFPILTCAKEQLEERHQISENAEQEAAVEFLAQGCSAGESDSVCRIPGTQQDSTSICFNDPGKGLPVSGFVLETAEVSMFAVQDMQVCPPDNDSAVCLPSQVVKNDLTLADSDNQSGLRLCAPEEVEALKDDGCLVKDRDTHDESVVDYLHNNQKISSQAEAKVHDTIDSEVMACKQHNLETNLTEVVDGSEDIRPVMMSDASKDDIANDPANTSGEAENDRFDLPGGMGLDAVGDTNGDVSGRSVERSAVKAEKAIGAISDDTGSVVIGELDKDVAEHSLATNAVESEDMKHEDTHGNVKVEDDIRVNMNETEDTHGDVKVEDDIKVNMKETEGTHGDVKVEDDIKVNTNETGGTHGDGKVEDDIKDNMDGVCTTVDEIKNGEQYISSESKEGNTDNCMTIDRTVSCESKEEKTDNLMAVDSGRWTDEAHPDGVGAHGGNSGAAEAVPREDDTTCTVTEMPSRDSSSSAENETVREDRPADAKRPHPESTTDVANPQVFDDKRSHEDVPRTEEKQERRHKRRKVVPSPGAAERRLTRSSSRDTVFRVEDPSGLL